MSPINDPFACDPLEGLTLVERAKIILGSRLTEDRIGHYRVDGKPASVFQVLEAANLRLGRV